MRTWRVGSFSMGAALLLLGIYLLFSQVFGFNLSHLMGSWWPIIFIILGVEILAYLYFSRKDQPLLKFDILSILIVGFLGTAGIFFAILSSTGIFQAVNQAWAENQTFDLPELSYSLNGGTHRVVIQTEHNPVTIESTSEKTLSIFGTYSTSHQKGEKLITNIEDYLSVNEKGDTLYVSMKKIPYIEVGPFTNVSKMEATILVPEHVQLEVMGNGNPITLKPRQVKSDWLLDTEHAHVNVRMEEKSDVTLQAVSAEKLTSQGKKWDVTRVKEKSGGEDDENDERKDGTISFGKGTYKIQILNPYYVHVAIQK